MHCDTLTVCLDGGGDIFDGATQINLNKLSRSGCAAQCFAVFTQNAGVGDFERYADFFERLVNGGKLRAVKRAAELNSDGAGAILTVENLGFIGKDLSYLSRLKDYGVKMASLVWNYENDLAYPNLVFDGGTPLFNKREKRGLKPLGRQAVEILDGLKIIVDISHLSDGGAEEILAGRKIPAVASHSNAAAIEPVSRNLTDGLIKKIADCGGVAGVNFCKDFLGAGDTFGRVEAHVRHIISAGGEDVVALGSDFDGIPPCKGLEGCEKMPGLLEFLSDKFTPRVAEKMAFHNFARVFGEVCG